MSEELDDLLRQKAASIDDSSPITGEARTPVAPPPSLNVVEVDRWSKRLAHGAIEDLKEHIRTGQADISTWPVPDGYDGDEGELNTEVLFEDVHTALFEPIVKFARDPYDKLRADWFEKLMGTEEFRSLRNSTVLNRTYSSAATHSVARSWMEYLKEHQEQNPDDPDGQGGYGSGKPNMRQEILQIKSAANAAKKAAAEVSEQKDAAEAFGIGDNGDHGAVDKKRLAEAFKKIRNDERLRKIIRASGRLRMRAASLQRAKSTSTMGSRSGIELSGDVPRLVPFELAQISGAIPELEMLALKRLADRLSMSYRCTSPEEQELGPIVVTVDESGSMDSGDRIITAKALALTFAWIARQQKRWFALVSYSDATDDPACFVANGLASRADDAAIMKWLTHFYYGGTDDYVPFGAVPKLWDKWKKMGLLTGKTDHVVITDGEFTVDHDRQESYRAWAKAENVRTFGLFVGLRRGIDKKDPYSPARVLDQYWTAGRTLEDNAEALDSLLSI